MLGGDPSLALSQHGSCRVLWVSGTDPRRDGRGASQGPRVSPAAAARPGPGEVSGLSAVNEEATVLHYHEVAFDPLPMNYPLQPHRWSGLPPSRRNRQDEAPHEAGAGRLDGSAPSLGLGSLLENGCLLGKPVQPVGIIS